MLVDSVVRWFGLVWFGDANLETVAFLLFVDVTRLLFLNKTVTQISQTFSKIATVDF